MKKFQIILFVLFLSPSFQGFSQIHINEWMASNSSVIDDPDFGDSGDWIELYNEGNDTVDLIGYFLTDNPENPDKWVFPSAKIAPAGFLLIWADRADTVLHTNFGLTREGEAIGLFSPSGDMLDQVKYPTQQTNISMGRITDGADSLGYFQKPTPGASNSTTAFAGLTFYRPLFSTRGGFYNGQVNVTLSSIDGEIRYTLDGSLPLANSPLYTNPIAISQTTNLRARVFVNNFIPGKPTTHTYFINEGLESRKLPVVSITTDDGYFWDADTGLYVQNFKPIWEYPINIELFENDGSNRAAFNELAGTRVNGQNSWVLPQKMLGIYFDNDYDKNNLEYQLFFDRNRVNFDNFVMRASGSDWSSTLFRDGLSQALIAENMDIERMGFRPAIAFVNGQYMGIHNLRSRIDEGFIEDNFGFSGSGYDLIENNGVVEQGDVQAFNDLFALFETDLSNPANFQQVENKMDIQNFTDYFITEIWSSNGSFGHNIQLWKGKGDGSKWRWILQDLDRSFTGSGDHRIGYFVDDGTPASYNWARISLRSMLENDAYKDQFVARFTDHLYTTFHPNYISAKIREFEGSIEGELTYHSARWAGTTSSYGNGIPSVAFWKREVDKLFTFADERNDIMIRDLKGRFGLEQWVNLGNEVFPPEAGHISLNGLKVPETPWNGLYFKNIPLTLKAETKPGYQFQGWTMANKEAIVNKSSNWKYLDNGSNQGDQWKNPGFNDSNWLSGSGEFGYGDNNEPTVLDFGSDPDDKHLTYYFRKEFTIQNLSEYSGKLLIHLLRDDGAVVYINGEEVLRSNMPEEPVNYQTKAAAFVGGVSETAFLTSLIETDKLVEGNNLIAVEVHQFARNSVDMSFDLQLDALKTSNGSIISTQEEVSFSLSVDTFLIANFSPTGQCILPKAITQNDTLKLECSPYLAVEDITILENISLTIEPGVEIHFSENASLIVKGDLQVKGTELEPVLFRAIDGGEKWGCIDLNSATDTSRFNWLEIIDASNGPHPIYDNAAIAAFQSDLELDHLTIVDVHSNPILGYYSNISLKNSQLHSRVTGDLINIKYGNGLIENCDFRGNDQVDTDAIDYDEVENGIIRNSKIYNFFGFNSDGIDLGEESPNVLIEGNFIHNCTDKGISIGQGSSILVRNNTIVNCSQGIAVKDLSVAEIDQNTFYNVVTPIACFEKNIGEGGGIGIVTNSILSNSIESSHFADEFSSLTISHSASDTDTLPGNDNFVINSQFESATYHDFRLKPGSPAINVGSDGMGGMIDLGTKSHLFAGVPSVLISGINYHPEDHPDEEYIELYNPTNSTIDLTGYTLSGAVELTFSYGIIPPHKTILVVKNDSFFSEPWRTVTWTSGRLSNGGETIRLADSMGIIIDQVTYDNESPWPLSADGQGNALSLISYDLDNHFAESWVDGMPVSIEEDLGAKSPFNVYPNPVKDILFIESEEGLQKIEILNLWGQTVLFQEIYRERQASLPLEKLPAGLYLIQINGKEWGRKLVVLE